MKRKQSKVYVGEYRVSGKFLYAFWNKVFAFKWMAVAVIKAAPWNYCTDIQLKAYGMLAVQTCSFVRLALHTLTCSYGMTSHFEWYMTVSSFTDFWINSWPKSISLCERSKWSDSIELASSEDVFLVCWYILMDDTLLNNTQITQDQRTRFFVCFYRCINASSMQDVLWPSNVIA